MYGRDSPTRPWSAPRQSSAHDPQPPSSASPRNPPPLSYFGMDDSDNGGFTHIRGIAMHSRTNSSGSGASTGPERPFRDRVNQISAAFFWKATMVIIQQRMNVVYRMGKNGSKMANKWFNLELDEQESFREELRPWRTCDSFERKPEALIIETYLDTSDLTATQALVVLEDGERWNVGGALQEERKMKGVQEPDSKARGRVLLERWRMELSEPHGAQNPPDLQAVYRHCIVVFRTLFAYCNSMPAWKFRRRLQKMKLGGAALKVGCRVLGESESARETKRWDGLQARLGPGKAPVTESYTFGQVATPAGYYKISVVFRENCDFRVDETDSLLSSHFLNLDESYFRPATGPRVRSQPYGEPGSLPSTGSDRARFDSNPTYGSLSTFHQGGPTGASPISTLRNAQDMERIERPLSGSPSGRDKGSVRDSKSSLRSVEGAPISRRGSLTFMQPFKAPSLSSSPAPISDYGGSLGRNTARDSLHRRGFSVGNFAVQQSKPPTPAPAPPASTSPRPGSQGMGRISSSFGNRRPRVSSTASRTEHDRDRDRDDNSSGKASYSSSTQYMHELGGSSYEEDLQIKDFMSLLADGQNATLKSFQSGSSAGAKRTANKLSKFQQMRESQSALADSMSQSLMMNPGSSPSTSSRNLSNVPGMASTFSSSASPVGKPISPHTPHTPAVPSRLSEGLTAQYDTHLHHRLRPGRPATAGPAPPVSTATTSPLDIPLSPRFHGPRRANSMSQPREPEGGRESLEFDLGAPYENSRQSTSLGSVNMVPLSMSRLLGSGDATAAAAAAVVPLPEPEGDDDGLAFSPSPEATRGGGSSGGGYSTSTGRFSRDSRTGRISVRGRGSPVMGDRDEAGSSSSGGRPIVGRRTPSWNRGGMVQDDEELLFAMSDMCSRRSLEEQERGGWGGRRRSRGGGSGSGAGEEGRGGRHWGMS